MPRFRLHAFAVLALFAWSAGQAAACCLFPGWGAWGVFRPLTWTGYYGPASVCCPPGWGAASACVGGCPGGTCPGGCSVQTYYGPVGTSACCAPCGVICCDGTGGGANCCVQYAPSSNEPIPDSNISNKGSSDQLRPDDFRGTPGGTGSSSDWQSRDRSSPAERSGDYLGEPRSIDDWTPSPRSSLPSGGDAPPFTPPAQSPAPPTQSPATPPNQSPAPINNEEGIRFNRVEPLPVDGPVALTYRASRQRVRLSPEEAATPPAVARRASEVNTDWRAVPRGEDVARR